MLKPLNSPQKIKMFLAALLPAVLIVTLSVYVLSTRPAAQDELRTLPGRPLAAFEDIYPIQPNSQGALTLDVARFSKAIDQLSTNPSARAIADLLYLGGANNITLLLDGPTREKYSKLGQGSNYSALLEANKQQDKLLATYVEIVNGIGQTFAGTPIEIVLHDTRNPLKSIVALQNPISGRRIGDTNTNFGLQLIRNYSQAAGSGSFISYGLSLKDGRPVKSSTIPLFDETYGLIAFICINIDLSKINTKDPAAMEHFAENFRAVTENEAITEMIQNSRRKP